MTNNAIARIDKYESDNLTCARLILANLGRYGAGSLPALWAKLIVEKQAQKIQEAA
jgi:hypothetical protein